MRTEIQKLLLHNDHNNKCKEQTAKLPQLASRDCGFDAIRTNEIFLTRADYRRCQEIDLIHRQRRKDETKDRYLMYTMFMAPVQA